MKPSYGILALSDLLLMAITATTGLMVHGQAGFARHFLLGILTGLFTCLVHVVLFMYFVVQEKIVTQSILHHGLDATYSPRVQKFKSRALRLSCVGIVAVLITIWLGAAIGVSIRAEVHLVVAFAAVFTNAIVFFFQYVLIHEYGELHRAAFGE